MVIEVPDDLHTQLKRRAVDEGRPLSAIVRGLIKDYLDQKGKKSHGDQG